jgi:uncharacterized protein (TIGR02271 family)
MNDNAPLLPVTSPQPSTPLSTGAPTRLSTDAEPVRVLPIIEEHATIRRELVETGRVRLTRQVHETTEEVSVPVQHDEVHVERVPLNVTLPSGAPTPVARYEGDTLIIPVLREVAVVETRLLLVEELRVTKQQVTTQYTETVHLRKEDIIVEHQPMAPTSPDEAT